jgi:hypothetical protein
VSAAIVETPKRAPRKPKSPAWNSARTHMVEALAELIAKKIDSDPIVTHLRAALVEVDALASELPESPTDAYLKSAEFQERISNWYADCGLLDEAKTALKHIRKARRQLDALYADQAEDAADHFADGASELYWADFWLKSIAHHAKRFPRPPAPETKDKPKATP